MERSEFRDGFTTFLADYQDGKAVVPPELEAVVRERERELEVEIEEQWQRELFARGMFERRVHGSCTSSAIYLCGGLRAVGLPTRIVLSIPLVDANDPEQLALVEAGIRHHRVRATALKGLRRLKGSWASHTFNEVFVDGRWRRLNYTRLGQPILDEGLYGLTTHILTVRDWADARMGRTVGRRQGLNLRDEVFPTANPYTTLEVSDQFGAHAEIENPPVVEPDPIAAVTIVDAHWVASDERPAHVKVSGVDLETDRLHIVLHADADAIELDGDLLDTFWGGVEKEFQLVPPAGEPVIARAVRGFWWGRYDDRPYLYFLLRLEDRDRLATGVSYALVPTAAAAGEPRFVVGDGVAVETP